MKYLRSVLREWIQFRASSDFDVSLRSIPGEPGFDLWGRSRVLLCSGARSTTGGEMP